MQCLYVYLLTDSNILQCAAQYTELLCAAKYTLPMAANMSMSPVMEESFSSDGEPPS